MPFSLNVLSVGTTPGVYIADTVVYSKMTVTQVFQSPSIASPLITYHCCASPDMVDDKWYEVVELPAIPPDIMSTCLSHKTCENLATQNIQ
ncbi:hypothetical protein SRHO_G00003180 [Serrasalmus rhombeus]